MNTRERLHHFTQERRIYLQLCRIQYGYKPRANVRVIGASNMAGLISALFGCALTLTFFSAIDGAIMNFVKPLQSIDAGDLFAMITSYLMG